MGIDNNEESEKGIKLENSSSSIDSSFEKVSIRRKFALHANFGLGKKKMLTKFPQVKLKRFESLDNTSNNRLDDNKGPV